jgi:dienelactone hydrolase
MMGSTLPKIILAGLLAVTGGTAASAALHRESVSYAQGGNTFIGYLVYDDAIQGTRPGVVVVHEWMGLNDYAKHRADQLAELGYVAFAADMYGNGMVATSTAEAGKLAGALKNDRPLMRARINAALDVLKKQKLVDRNRLAAIGYCFGGTAALELARSGADVLGVVSFHGGLDSPTPADASHIRGKVLALHGADDPNVPPAQVTAFQEEMRKGRVDWQMNYYSGAVHGFTNPANGNDPSRGVAYNEAADRRSWQAMKDFFAEIFKPR